MRNLKRPADVRPPFSFKDESPFVDLFLLVVHFRSSFLFPLQFIGHFSAEFLVTSRARRSVCQQVNLLLIELAEIYLNFLIFVVQVGRGDVSADQLDANPLFFSRTKGLFRVCFDDKKVPRGGQLT